MKWFLFQGILLHTEDNIDCPVDNLKSFSKVFSMLKIRIIYDETIDSEDIPEAAEIIYINCVKSIGFSLDNQMIEDLITHFFTSMCSSILVYYYYYYYYYCF